MDIADILRSLTQYTSEFASDYCIVNGEVLRLDEIQKMGYDEFSYRSKLNMPQKLYRYYPNRTVSDNKELINYSVQALKNNTVFLQSPTQFDDVYDSDIYIDFSEYERLKLIEWCRRCEIKIDDKASTEHAGNLFLQYLWNWIQEHGDLKNAITRVPSCEIENLSNTALLLQIENLLWKTGDLGQALSSIIAEQHRKYSDHLKTIFRTSCFATTPYSQLMWGGSYADCHKGFCIEYTVLPNDSKYQNVYYNLFPMIYCKTRPNMTEKLTSIEDNELTKEIFWDIYFNGALRKSIDWAFQNEWRLLLPMNAHNTNDYNIEFFPITKVFLGNRMKAENRKEVIDICNSLNIPYVGVTRNPTVFEMQNCPIKCEDCSHFTSKMNNQTT